MMENFERTAAGDEMQRMAKIRSDIDAKSEALKMLESANKRTPSEVQEAAIAKLKEDLASLRQEEARFIK